MKVLFVCMSNSRRSIMAEAVYNKIVSGGATSAGVDPKNYIDPNVIIALNEIDARPFRSKPQKLTDVMMAHSDAIVTFRCSEFIPDKFQHKVENWEYGRKRNVGEDQSERTLDEIIGMRDDIRKMVLDFIHKHKNY